MTKDEMKNRISMALKDPTLQQGFEIICKNLAEFEKENAELKSIADFQTSSNMDRYFQLKRNKDLLTKAKEIIREETRLLGNIVSIERIKDEHPNKVIEQAEAFLKEYEIREDRLCEHCDQYKCCPDGKRCRTCDDGSNWKRQSNS